MVKGRETFRSPAKAAAVVLFLPAAIALGAPESSRPKIRAPGVVSYQGRITEDGAPYSGTGYFKFAVVDAAGSTTYWSNDGTSTGGAEPDDGTPLPVTDGRFTVRLGDSSLTNMTVVPASVFDGTERYLRIWFSTDYLTFQQLSPDQRIAATAYALQAQTSATTDDADTLNGHHAGAFSSVQHEHPGTDITSQVADANTVDGEDAEAFADAVHTHDGLLPSGAMVMSHTDTDTTLLTAGFSSTGLAIDNTGWVVKADMPTGRQSATAAVVDGIIYVIGGHAYNPALDWKYNEAYDPATDSWSSKAPMPTQRMLTATTVAGGLIYCLGGQRPYAPYGGAEINEAYSPAIDAWLANADIPYPRVSMSAASADGIVYAIGGSGYGNRNDAYDPETDSWSRKADIPTARELGLTATVNGIVYVIGGDGTGANEAYDPATDAWSSKTSMPTFSSGHTATVRGLIYILAGGSEAIDVYDPANDSWSVKGHLPTRRDYAAVAASDGVIYVIGGYFGSDPTSSLNQAYIPELHVYRKD
jgi:N-acetylneuraminic acid mutarotase